MLLFVGISSFIGQNFLASYRGDLIGTYNKSVIIEVKKNGALFKKLDIANYDEVYSLFKNNSIDEVVMTASVIQAKNKKTFHNVNVKGVSNVIKAMKNFGVKRIIYISTAVLYNKEKFWGEYGRTKNIAEQLIRESGLDYVILRPTEIYGPHEKAGLGKLIHLIRTYKIMPIVNGGKNLLTPIHVGDVCEIIKICLIKNIFDKNTYLLAGGQKLSLREFIIFVAEKINKDIVLLNTPIVLLNFISIIFPFIINREQILRAVNTLAFVSKKTEKRFDFKFRQLDLSYLD